MIALLRQQNEPKHHNLVSELDDLINKLSLDDAMDAESYLGLDYRIDREDCEANWYVSDVVEDEDDAGEKMEAIPVFLLTVKHSYLPINYWSMLPCMESIMRP